MTRWRILVFLAMALGLSACQHRGCGSRRGATLRCSEHDNDDPEKTCDENANLGCDKFYNLLRCETWACAYKDRESCVSVNKALCLNQLKLSGTGLTVGMVWAGSRYRENEGTGRPEPEGDDTCDGQGKLLPGDTCVDNAQCKNGYCWRSEVRSLCGKCRAYVRKGDPCFETHCDYHAGLTCRDGICRRALEIGDDCKDAECPVDAWCESGTCVPEKTEGKSCVADGQCSFESHLVCQEGRCQKPVYAREGEDCERDSICTPGLRCREDKCVRVAVGETCTDSVFDCAPMQRCRKEERGDRRGKCVDRVLPGGSCDSSSWDDECVHGLRCVENRCVAVNDSMCK